VISLVGTISGKSFVKIVATRCHILKLKCTKFDFVWGSAPDPAAGAYSAPPDPLTGFKGPTSKGKEGRRREGRGWEGEGLRGGERKGERERKGVRGRSAEGEGVDIAWTDL